MAILGWLLIVVAVGFLLRLLGIHISETTAFGLILFSPVIVVLILGIWAWFRGGSQGVSYRP